MNQDLIRHRSDQIKIDSTCLIIFFEFIFEFSANQTLYIIIEINYILFNIKLLKLKLINKYLIMTTC
jgi:hypothetical protein